MRISKNTGEENGDILTKHGANHTVGFRPSSQADSEYLDPVEPRKTLDDQFAEAFEATEPAWQRYFDAAPGSPEAAAALAAIRGAEESRAIA